MKTRWKILVGAILTLTLVLGLSSVAWAGNITLAQLVNNQVVSCVLGSDGNDYYTLQQDYTLGSADTLTINADLTIPNEYTLTVNGTIVITDWLTGNVTNNGQVVFDCSNAEPQYLSGTMSGTGTLKVKSASMGQYNIAAFHGQYSCTGNIEIIDYGRICIENSGSQLNLATGATLTINAGSELRVFAAQFENNGTVNNSGTISNSVSGSITNNGSVVNTGSIINEYSMLTNSGDLLNTGVLTNEGEFVVKDNGNVPSNLTNTDGIIVFDSDADQSYSGILSGAIGKDGTGTLTLSGAINADLMVAAGTVNITGTGVNLGDVEVDTGANLSVAAGTQVTVTGTTTIDGTLTNAGTLTNNGDLTNSGKLVIKDSGNVPDSVTNDGTIVFDSGSAQSYDGALSGTIEKKGTGTLTLSSSDIDVALTVRAGAVDIQSDGVAITDLHVDAGATLTVSPNASVTLDGSAAVAGTLNNDGTLTNEGTLTNSGTVNDGGTLDNKGTITNQNGGTITVTGTLIDGGALTNDGALVVNGTGALKGAGAITGTGTISGDADPGNFGPSTYVLILDAGSGKIGTASKAQFIQTSATFDVDALNAIPARAGYLFSGWKDAAGQPVSGSYTMADHTATLLAQWTFVPAPATANPLDAAKDQLGALDYEKGGALTLKVDVTGLKFEGGEALTLDVTIGTAKASATIAQNGVATFRLEDSALNALEEGEYPILLSSPGNGQNPAMAQVQLGALTVKAAPPAPATWTMPKTFKARTGVAYPLITWDKGAQVQTDIRSSKPKVVSVDAYGRITALKTGTAKLTVTGADGQKQTCKVTVKANIFTRKACVKGEPDAVWTSAKRLAYKGDELIASVFIANHTGSKLVSADALVFTLLEDGKAIYTQPLDAWSPKGGVKNKAVKIYQLTITPAQCPLLKDGKLDLGSKRYDAVITGWASAKLTDDDAPDADWAEEAEALTE